MIIEESFIQPAVSLLPVLPADDTAQAVSVHCFLERANRQLVHRIALISFVADVVLSIVLGIIFMITRDPVVGLATGVSAAITMVFGFGWWLSRRAQLWLVVVVEVSVIFLASFGPALFFPDLDFIIGVVSVPIICFISINNSRRMTTTVGLICILATLVAFSHPLPTSMVFGLGAAVLPAKVIITTIIILNGWAIYNQLTRLQQEALILAETSAIEAGAAQAEAEAARAEVERLQQAEQLRLLKLVETLELPILPVGDSTLVVPLVGDLDTRRAAAIQQRLLEAVARQRILTVVVDVTSISVLDTTVAQQLVQIAHAVRLLGVRIVLSGIGARLAQTLVGLDVALGDIETPGNLGQALATIRNQK